MKNLPQSAEHDGSNEFVNRKLIRPTLPAKAEARPIDGTGAAAAAAPARAPEEKRERRTATRQAYSGEQTHAENFYYQKQMQSQTPMTVVLKNGETVQGVIEWYDKSCIKLNRMGRNSLLIYKSGIRYLHKTSE